MADYTENVNRIVSVAWSTKQYAIRSVANTGALRQFIVDTTPTIGEGVTSDLAGKIITGDTSGASIDTSNLPVDGGDPPHITANPSTPTACTYGLSNLYDIDTGAAVTVEPALGYSLNNGIVWALSVQNSIYNVTTEQCDLQFDAPAIPGFINGETVSITTPT